MIAQAAGFAVLAAMSPTSLLVMAVFLGSNNPRRTALVYLAGAVLMSVVMAVLVLYIIRGVGLDHASERTPRYWLRFVLGVLALASALVIILRGRRAAARPAEAVLTKPPGRTKPPGLVSRLTASPSPRTAFVAGVLLFAPSTTFIAAVQVVATARAAVPVTVLGLVIIVAITVLIIWLPLLAYLAAPDVTTRALTAMNGWLRVNGRIVAVGALAVCGVVLVANGLLNVT